MKSTLLIAFIAAFLLSLVLGPIVLPILRKIKAGQTVRDDGPESHLKKNGTPTMGAFIYLISASVNEFCWALISTSLNPTTALSGVRIS